MYIQLNTKRYPRYNNIALTISQKRKTIIKLLFVILLKANFTKLFRLIRSLKFANKNI